MYTIFLGYVLFMGLFTGGMLVMASAFPDTPIRTPWNVQTQINSTNIPALPTLYNGSNPNDANSTVGHMLNPTNSSGGPANNLNRILAFGQITIEVIWYIFTIVTLAMPFQLLGLIGFPTVAVIVIQFPVGLFGAYLIYHMVTGKL